jgi:hypothetical protein
MVAAQSLSILFLYFVRACVCVCVCVVENKMELDNGDPSLKDTIAANLPYESNPINN